jgi:HD superfamily phosphohydrolase
VTRPQAQDAPHRADTPPDDQPRRAAGSGGLGRTGRSLVLPDPLYGGVRVAAWAAALITTPPFRRLAGVSLSDVPGELLFGHPFPSRLDHTLGVYYLARLARPHDRTLQAAALAHDLGHGPFSHLTEPLMRERLGLDHEHRSTRLLDDVRAALSDGARRQLAWLDWDEVAALVVGREDGRGALLNGPVDYDNADNVARFLLGSGLARPSYDPQALTKALRPLPADQATPTERTYLQAGAEGAALAWRADRERLYEFLHAGHRNLAAHAMLRKAIDLSAAADLLPPDVFDLTDAEALRLLCAVPDRGVRALTERVLGGERHHYRCVWEAQAPASVRAIPERLRHTRERLALEQRLAGETALLPHEVIVEAVVSRAWRPLPPIEQPGHPSAYIRTPPALPAPRVIHVFATPDAAPDYVRRLQVAAERLFIPLGATPVEDDGEGGV